MGRVAGGKFINHRWTGINADLGFGYYAFKAHGKVGRVKAYVSRDLYYGWTVL
jgi:hypothetical protein